MANAPHVRYFGIVQKTMILKEGKKIDIDRVKTRKKHLENEVRKRINTDRKLRLTPLPRRKYMP